MGGAQLLSLPAVMAATLSSTLRYCPAAGAPLWGWCGQTEQLAQVRQLREDDAVGFLAGPFTTRGGEWIMMADLFFKSSLPLFTLPKGGRVGDFTGDAVDERGQAIPLPPLHMHHIHLARVLPEGVDDRIQQHWMETHGDYRLYAAGGDMQPGYTTPMPAGTCRLIGPNATLRLFAEVNDVRPVNETAPVTWWLRIRLQNPPATCRPVGKVVFWFPIDEFALRSRILGYDTGADERLTWWTMRVPTRLRLIGQPWVHSHRGRYAGLIVIRNGPRDPWELSPSLESPTSCRSRKECQSLDMLRLHLEVEAQQLVLRGRAGSLLCFDQAPSNSSRVATTDAGYTLHADQPSPISCRTGKDAELLPGDRLTFYAFSRANYDEQVNPYPQHLMLFSHAELLPVADKDLPAARRARGNGSEWDISRAVYIHPRPSNEDEYGVWHLGTGKVEQLTLKEPPGGRC